MTIAIKGRYLLILYLVTLFIFVFAKAWLVPFTHDECQTYTIFAEHSGQGNTANNHRLNTWTAYLFYLLFGNEAYDFYYIFTRESTLLPNQTVLLRSFRVSEMSLYKLNSNDK